MARRTQYGNNFVVLYDDENGVTKEEVLQAYNEYAEGRRQQARIEYDVAALEELDENRRYATLIRQYTPFRPARTLYNHHLYNRVFVSRCIQWW